MERGSFSLRFGEKKVAKQKTNRIVGLPSTCSEG
jgi:hypothetical protein